MKELPFSKNKALRKFVKQTNSSEYKELKKECDNLRREIVYLRAGYKSELSERPGKQIGGKDVLNDHHPAGKPNNRLRYELDNAICLTQSEHFYIAHNQGEGEKFRAWILQKKGANFFDRMALLRNAKSPDIRTIKMYLEQELRKLNANHKP